MFFCAFSVHLERSLVDQRLFCLSALPLASSVRGGRYGGARFLVVANLYHLIRSAWHGSLAGRWRCREGARFRCWPVEAWKGYVCLYMKWLLFFLFHFFLFHIIICPPLCCLSYHEKRVFGE